jgi:hypothetical protein
MLTHTWEAKILGKSYQSVSIPNTLILLPPNKLAIMHTSKYSHGKNHSHINICKGLPWTYNTTIYINPHHLH